MHHQVDFIQGLLDQPLSEQQRLADYQDMLAAKAERDGVPAAVFNDFVTDNLLGMNIAGIARWRSKQEKHA